MIDPPPPPLFPLLFTRYPRLSSSPPLTRLPYKRSPHHHQNSCPNWRSHHQIECQDGTRSLYNPRVSSVSCFRTREIGWQLWILAKATIRSEQRSTTLLRSKNQRRERLWERFCRAAQAKQWLKEDDQEPEESKGRALKMTCSTRPGNHLSFARLSCPTGRNMKRMWTS